MNFSHKSASKWAFDLLESVSDHVEDAEHLENFECDIKSRNGKNITAWIFM